MKRPSFEYAPFRKYHTQRVKRLRGETLFQKLKFLYEHDAEFRINTELFCVISFSLFAAISIVTLLFLIV